MDILQLKWMVFEITNLLVGLNMAEYNTVDLHWKTDQQKMSKLKHRKETETEYKQKDTFKYVGWSQSKYLIMCMISGLEGEEKKKCERSKS